MSAMKRMKKIFALLLAVVMMMGLGLTASAATITINNAADGETYTAYKLFDVSIARDEDGTATSYSYYIENTEENSALITLLDQTIGLDLTLSADGSRYNVNTELDGTVFETDTGTMTAAALAEELLENIGSLTPAQDGVEASDEVATIDGLDEGYYFVDTTLGSLCILNTAGQTIYEKNSTPHVTKAVQEDRTGAFGESATIDVTDTIHYQLIVNTGTNTNGTGTGIDGNYVIKDILPDGISYITDSISIDGWEIDTDYTIDPPTVENDNTLTITLLSTGKLGGLAQDTNITITYNAQAAANMSVDTPYTNTVTLTYKNQTSTDTASVQTYDIDGGAEGNTFIKVDATNDEPLEGVKFVLSKGTGAETRYAQFGADKYLTEWVTAQDEATELVTDGDGHIYAYGLDADTYILTETETLPGYNLLADTITVTISEEGVVTYKYTSDSEEAGSTITVENETGSLLPSTGGMGTTLIYIAGAVLVIGAGVLLVVRRRMNAEQ